MSPGIIVAPGKSSTVPSMSPHWDSSDCLATHSIPDPDTLTPILSRTAPLLPSANRPTLIIVGSNILFILTHLSQKSPTSLQV